MGETIKSPTGHQHKNLAKPSTFTVTFYRLSPIRATLTAVEGKHLSPSYIAARSQERWGDLSPAGRQERSPGRHKEEEQEEGGYKLQAQLHRTGTEDFSTHHCTL